MRMRRKSNHKQLMDSGFCLFNSKSQTATLMDENKDGPLQAPNCSPRSFSGSTAGRQVFHPATKSTFDLFYNME